MLDTESTIIQMQNNICPILTCTDCDDKWPDIYTNCMAVTVCCSLFAGFIALVVLLSIS